MGGAVWLKGRARFVRFCTSPASPTSPRAAYGTLFPMPGYTAVRIAHAPYSRSVSGGTTVANVSGFSLSTEAPLASAGGRGGGMRSGDDAD